MKIINFIISIIIESFHPETWFQYNIYSKECENWCIENLKNPQIKEITEFKANFNGKKIWITNRPYGFHFLGSNTRPKRKTIRKIYKEIDKTFFKEKNNESNNS